MEPALMKGAVWMGVLIAAAGASGCGRVDEFRRSRHLAAAERFAHARKYKEATIEYRNALRFAPDDLPTVRKLAWLYYDSGQIGEAFPPLKRYVDESPHDLEARQRLGTIYLMGRAPAEAREQAEAILAQQPDSLDALLLVAEAAETPAEVEAAIGRLERQRARVGDPSRVARALGVLYARKGNLSRAEEELRAAVSSRPDSPESHLALARLHYGKGDLPSAEREFQAAAALAPAGSFAVLQLADFYVRTRRLADAKRVLIRTVEQAPDAFPAWLRLAEIASLEGDVAEAETRVGRVLQADPDNPAALVIQSRLQVARRQASRAVESATRAVQAEPGNAQAYLALAVAQRAAGNPALALAAAKEAVTRDPKLADAVFLVAGLEAETGDTVGAIAGLRAYLDGHPTDARGWETLGQAQLRARDPAAAHGSFGKAAELTPGSPRGPYLLGLALIAQGRAGDARRELERSLERDASFAPALDQLAAMSLAAHDAAAAVARVERQSRAAPGSAAIQHLLGRVSSKAGDLKRAEAAYRRALELDPGLSGAYVGLGELYASSREYGRAIADLEKALARDPDDPAALMLWSIAQQMNGNAARAREGYEKLLSANPRFAPAANNLSWMLAEEGKELERAFLLAQSARDAAPEDPQVADTLGWVFYKRGAYPRAEALFREAAERLPASPDVQYHLGMAQARLGQSAEARASLEKSLQLSPAHAGAADARATLASLPSVR